MLKDSVFHVIVRAQPPSRENILYIYLFISLFLILKPGDRGWFEPSMNKFYVLYHQPLDEIHQDFKNHLQVQPRTQHNVD